MVDMRLRGKKGMAMVVLLAFVFFCYGLCAFIGKIKSSFLKLILILLKK